MDPVTPDIEDLYRSYGGLVRARIRRFFSDDQADDVLQEVFVRVLEKLHTFRGESSPSTWLYQITTRHCLNRVRDSSRRRVLVDDSTDVPWSRPISTADQEAKVLLGELWRDLDEETAAIAVYYYLDRMTRDDVAAMVGLSSRTVGYRLEALRKMAQAKGGA
jgi:RNA polymerase sigma-70 factor (ECF subfamily)